MSATETPQQTAHGWLLAFAVVAVLCQLRPIDDVDLFTQIALGWHQLESRALVSTEPLTLINDGSLVTNPGWLSQIFFAFVHEIGGLVLTRCVFAIIIGLSFIVVLSLAPYTSAAAALLGTLLSFLAIGSNTSVRPQGIALSCFSVCLALICRTPPGWRVLLLGVAVLWQNFHPSVQLLAGVSGGAALWCFLSTGRRQEGIKWCWAALIAIVSSIATPDGMRLWSAAGDNTVISREILRISEWQPPWDAAVAEAMLGFWVAVLVTGALWLLVRRTPRLMPVWCVLLAATLYAARFGLFWGLVNAAVCAELLGKVRLRVLSRPAPPWLKKAPVTFLTCLAAVSPLLLHSGDPISPQIPVRVFAELRDRLPKEARIYNYREWGGPLEYALYGNAKVAIDGRLYLYSADEWREYVRFAAGKMSVEELERRHSPDLLVLHAQFHAALIQQVDAHGGWERLYSPEDSSVRIFIKRRYRTPAAS